MLILLAMGGYGKHDIKEHSIVLRESHHTATSPTI